MSIEEIFFLNINDYKRNINPITNYKNQMSLYISKMRGIPIDQAQKIVVDIINKNMKNPTVKFFQRENFQDRVVAQQSLLGYINDSITNDTIMVPTFTVYVNPNVKKSIIGEFLSTNVKKRNISKRQAQEAKNNNNIVLYINKNNEQKVLKSYNNSASGAFAQESCILYNKSAHSSLTTTTRTVSSIGNANNEKFVAGNRYYDSVNTVLNNCLYILDQANINSIKSVVDKYNLHQPTTDDTIKVLKYSSDLYWQDNDSYERIVRPFLDKLNGYERAAICYIGDFYHLRVFNNDFIRYFIDNLCQTSTNSEPVEGVEDKLEVMNEDLLNLCHLLFFYEVKGLGKNYHKFTNKQLLYDMYHTANNIIHILNNYKDLIQALFINNIIPNNNNKIKLMRRRVVVLSDTDSTCFSTDEWVKWYNNDKFEINKKNIQVSSIVAYLCTQTIKHLLAMISANMNIPKDKLTLLGMKNEYMWLVHMPSEVVKHYVAYTAMQERSVYEKEELEIKGVHYINSAIPPNIINDFKDYVKSLFNDYVKYGSLSASKVLLKCIDFELNIINSIVENKDYALLKRSKIKDANAYAQEADKSPYQRHTLWQDVFEFKYGTIQNPPYNVIKIPTIVTSKQKLTNWLNTITDEELKIKLHQWLTKYKKDTLPTIYLNEDYVNTRGIPEEIKSIINYDRIVLDLTSPYRLLIESLGFILTEDKPVFKQFNRDKLLLNL